MKGRVWPIALAAISIISTKPAFGAKEFSIAQSEHSIVCGMSKAMRTLARLVGVMALIMIFGQLTVTPPAHAQGFSASAFLPNEVVAGNTYSEWAAAWNQWFISIPASINPSLDTTGEFCDEKQNRRAFFLAGSGAGPVTRSCTVPCSKPIFFPLLTVECSSVEAPPFFGANSSDRLVCAQQLGDLIDIGSLKVTIDGVDVTSLNRFRVAGPDTDFRMSPTDNVLGVPVSKGFSRAPWARVGLRRRCPR